MPAATTPLARNSPSRRAMSARICSASGEAASACGGAGGVAGTAGAAQAASINAVNTIARMGACMGYSISWSPITLSQLNDSLARARRHHHDDLAAFEARLVLDLGDRLQFAAHALEQFHAEVGV